MVNNNAPIACTGTFPTLPLASAQIDTIEQLYTRIESYTEVDSDNYEERDRQYNELKKNLTDITNANPAWWQAYLENEATLRNTTTDTVIDLLFTIGRADLAIPRFKRAYFLHNPPDWVHISESLSKIFCAAGTYFLQHKDCEEDIRFILLAIYKQVDPDYYDEDRSINHDYPTTPFTIAIQCKLLEVIENFHSRNGDLFAKVVIEGCRKTNFSILSEKVDEDFCIRILDSIDVTNGQSGNILCQLIAKEDDIFATFFCEKIISKNPPWWQKSGEREYIFSEAIRGESKEIALHLAPIIDVNLKEREKWSEHPNIIFPVIDAARQGWTDIVTILCERNADLEVMYQGKSAFEWILEECAEDAALIQRILQHVPANNQKFGALVSLFELLRSKEDEKARQSLDDAWEQNTIPAWAEDKKLLATIFVIAVQNHAEEVLAAVSGKMEITQGVITVLLQNNRVPAASPFIAGCKDPSIVKNAIKNCKNQTALEGLAELIPLKNNPLFRDILDAFIDTKEAKNALTVISKRLLSIKIDEELPLSIYTRLVCHLNEVNPSWWQENKRVPTKLLFLAIEKRNSDLANALASHCTISECDRGAQNETAILAAARAGMVQTVLHLMRKGFSITKTEENGKTALHCLIENQTNQSLDQLCEEAFASGDLARSIEGCDIVSQLFDKFQADLGIKYFWHCYNLNPKPEWCTKNSDALSQLFCDVAAFVIHEEKLEKECKAIATAICNYVDINGRDNNFGSEEEESSLTHAIELKWKEIVEALALNSNADLFETCYEETLAFRRIYEDKDFGPSFMQEVLAKKDIEHESTGLLLHNLIEGNYPELALFFYKRIVAAHPKWWNEAGVKESICASAAEENNLPLATLLLPSIDVKYHGSRPYCGNEIIEHLEWVKTYVQLLETIQIGTNLEAACAALQEQLGQKDPPSWVNSPRQLSFIFELAASRGDENIARLVIDKMHITSACMKAAVKAKWKTIIQELLQKINGCTIYDWIRSPNCLSDPIVKECIEQFPIKNPALSVVLEFLSSPPVDKNIFVCLAQRLLNAPPSWFSDNKEAKNRLLQQAIACDAQEIVKAVEAQQIDENSLERIERRAQIPIPAENSILLIEKTLGTAEAITALQKAPLEDKQQAASLLSQIAARPYFSEIVFRRLQNVAWMKNKSDVTDLFFAISESYTALRLVDAIDPKKNHPVFGTPLMKACCIADKTLSRIMAAALLPISSLAQADHMCSSAFFCLYTAFPDLAAEYIEGVSLDNDLVPLFETLLWEGFIPFTSRLLQRLQSSQELPSFIEQALSIGPRAKGIITSLFGIASSNAANSIAVRLSDALPLQDQAYLFTGALYLNIMHPSFASNFLDHIKNHPQFDRFLNSEFLEVKMEGFVLSEELENKRVILQYLLENKLFEKALHFIQETPLDNFEQSKILLSYLLKSTNNRYAEIIFKRMCALPWIEDQKKLTEIFFIACKYGQISMALQLVDFVDPVQRVEDRTPLMAASQMILPQEQQGELPILLRRLLSSQTALIELDAQGLPAFFYLSQNFPQIAVNVISRHPLEEIEISFFDILIKENSTPFASMLLGRILETPRFTRFLKAVSLTSKSISLIFDILFQQTERKTQLSAFYDRAIQDSMPANRLIMHLLREKKDDEAEIVCNRLLDPTKEPQWVKDRAERTSLFFNIALHGNSKLSLKLVDSMDVQLRTNPNKKTPLMVACSFADTVEWRAVVEKLLLQKYTLTDVDAAGRSLISYIHKTFPDIAKRLIDNYPIDGELTALFSTLVNGNSIPLALSLFERIAKGGLLSSFLQTIAIGPKTSLLIFKTLIEIKKPTEAVSFCKRILQAYSKGETWKDTAGSYKAQLIVAMLHVPECKEQILELIAMGADLSYQGEDATTLIQKIEEATDPQYVRDAIKCARLHDFAQVVALLADLLERQKKELAHMLFKRLLDISHPNFWLKKTAYATSLFFIVVFGKELQLASALLDAIDVVRGCRVTVTNGDSCVLTPLMAVAAISNEAPWKALVEKLLAKGASITALDSNGTSAFSYIHKMFPDIAKRLVDELPLDQDQNNFFSRLCAEKFDGYLYDLFYRLQSIQPAPRWWSGHSRALLFFEIASASKEREQIVDIAESLLLDPTLSLTATNEREQSVLMVALEYKFSTASIQSLLKRGGDIELLKYDSNGNSAFSCLSTRRNDILLSDPVLQKVCKRISMTTAQLLRTEASVLSLRQQLMDAVLHNSTKSLGSILVALPFEEKYRLIEDVTSPECLTATCRDRLLNYAFSIDPSHYTAALSVKTARATSVFDDLIALHTTYIKKDSDLASVKLFITKITGQYTLAAPSDAKARNEFYTSIKEQALHVIDYFKQEIAKIETKLGKKLLEAAQEDSGAKHLFSDLKTYFIDTVVASQKCGVGIQDHVRSYYTKYILKQTYDLRNCLLYDLAELRTTIVQQGLPEDAQSVHAFNGFLHRHSELGLPGSKEAEKFTDNYGSGHEEQIEYAYINFNKKYTPASIIHYICDNMINYSQDFVAFLENLNSEEIGLLERLMQDKVLKKVRPILQDGVKLEAQKQREIAAMLEEEPWYFSIKEGDLLNEETISKALNGEKNRMRMRYVLSRESATNGYTWIGIVLVLKAMHILK